MRMFGDDAGRYVFAIDFLSSISNLRSFDQRGTAALRQGCVGGWLQHDGRFVSVVLEQQSALHAYTFHRWRARVLRVKPGPWIVVN